jgi:hypothetical protein
MNFDHFGFDDDAFNVRLDQLAVIQTARLLAIIVCSEMLMRRLGHDGFDFWRRHTRTIACLQPPPLHERMRDVLPIADA